MSRRTGIATLVAFALAILTLAPAAQAARDFPKSFLWGTASAGFQSEAGGAPANVDKRSDWYRFTSDPGLIDAGVVSGDRIADGPGFLHEWRGDLDRAANGLGNNAIRLGIEWSRIFPRSTAGVDTGRRISRGELKQLDRLADHAAVRRYQRILAGAQRRGLDVMLTLNHFTLPIWVHDPIAVRAQFEGVGPDDPVPSDLRKAGWLSRSTVGEFRKFAAYAAWKLHDHVDRWVTLNEPLVTVSQGFVSIPGVTGVKAPAILSYPGALRAVENLGLANAAAYDAIHARDPHARVGFVQNMLDWRPDDPETPADVTSAANADAVLSRSFFEMAIRGNFDTDADGVEDPGEIRPKLAGKADFVGVNHYSPATAKSLGFPVTPTIPIFDFIPTIAYQGHANPGGPPCPTTCSDMGWEIDPSGLRHVVEEAASYGKPVYVTENGIDDADDDQRAGYMRSYLRALAKAIDDGADVRGYYAWSLIDNYEWAEGYAPSFGLYGYDPATLERKRRDSAGVYRRIARTGSVPRPGSGS
ncbi:MAG: glycoside hydrolase family 1 protein [Solirubrobacterales bacterium]